MGWDVHARLEGSVIGRKIASDVRVLTTRSVIHPGDRPTDQQILAEIFIRSMASDAEYLLIDLRSALISKFPPRCTSNRAPLLSQVHRNATR
jgi:hypothetical protein